MLASSVRVALVRYCITCKDWELVTASDDGLPGWSCFHPRLCVPSHLETFSYSGAEFTKQRSFLESLFWALVTWGVGSSSLCIRGVRYPQWVMTKGLTDLLGPCGGASCCILDLFPCKLPQCTYSSGVETITLCVALPPCSCCVCASVLLSVDFVPLSLWHVLSVSVIDSWVI